MPLEQGTIANKNEVNFNPFTRPEVEKVIYTTPSQAEVWIGCKIGGENANRAYNESVTLVLKGNLQRKALESAILKLIQRHESLRAVFSTDGRFMTIFKDLDLLVKYQDFSSFSAADKEIALENHLLEEAQYVFDLVRGPLFKAGILKISTNEHHLVLTAHHIICDGWSTGIILEELGNIYSSIIEDKEPSLPKAELFSEYADNQQELIKSDTYKKIEEFWLQQYSDSIPQVSLPTDFPRPQLRTFKSSRQDFLLDNDLLTSVKKVGVKAGSSLVTTIVSAFEVFLFRQTGQDDLVLGLPSSNQSFTGKTQLIGHCVNLLPLRSKLSVETTFNEYLKQRKNNLFDAYEHQSLSFGQLLQKLPIIRDSSRVPLVPVMFNIDMGMTNQVSFSGLSFQLKTNPREFEAFELFLNASGTNGSLLLEWSYNTSLFKPSTIEKMMDVFIEILTRVVKNPNDTIGNIIKADESPYQKLNETQVEYPNSPLNQLLASQAQLTPEKIAIEFNETQISYENLQKRVNAIAHQLIEKGVSPGDFVAVSLPRSEKLVIILMAIMQSGAAYLPLDPSYPAKRLDYMLEDSGATFFVTNDSMLTKVSTNSKIVILEDLFSKIAIYPTVEPNITINNNALAYILFTSGSTGKPKGVPISHKNLVNFLYSMSQEPGIKETDRLLSITTISFDIAGLELFLPLLKGATLVLTNDETVKDTRILLEVLHNKSITMLQATPTTWQMLLDAGWQKHLPIKALSGGEALPIGLAKKVLEKTDELWNMYGPTETTIWSAVKKVTLEDELITIGHPIANTQIHIVNEQGLPVALGTIGEIAIGGDGLANGYWKRPDLTKEKFLPNISRSTSKGNLYLTGDLGKLLPNNEVQCLGRKDQQVKIRGHRIELEEIEEALNTIKDIQNAVVLVKENKLTAYIILDKSMNTSEHSYDTWKNTLSAQLPSYMVPQNYKVLEKFPTTLNGKIDRNSLSTRTLEKEQSIDSTKIVSKSEELVASVWRESLNITNINPNDNFFELGGHSMIAVKVMVELEKLTTKRLPLSALLEYPTVKQLASLLDKGKPTFKWKSLVPMKPKGNKPPLFIVHGANYNVLVFEKLAQELDNDQPVYGLQAKGIDGIDEADDTIETMASNFISEIISVYPDGQYSLAGFSFGGIIAFEMYKQLKANGKKVKILALFDSYVYPNYYCNKPFKKKLMYKLYTLGQLAFVFLNMFSNKKNFERRIGLLKTMFNGLYLKFKYGKEKQIKMQFNRSTNIDKKHSLAFMKYTIEPQNIIVDLFRASEDVYFAHDFKFLGWKNIAKKGVRKHKVPGNHNDMFLPPNVQEFANLLQDTLDKNDSE
jgi:amino acid adenylation domain-containing protein